MLPVTGDGYTEQLTNTRSVVDAKGKLRLSQKTPLCYERRATSYSGTTNDDDYDERMIMTSIIG